MLDKNANCNLVCRQSEFNFNDAGIRHILNETDKDGNGKGKCLV